MGVIVGQILSAFVQQAARGFTLELGHDCRSLGGVFDPIKPRQSRLAKTS